jgi:hypothetical protein
MITVYRSADLNAEEEAQAIRNVLVRNGIDAHLVDDNTPGVQSGSFAVQVPEEQAAQAEALVAEAATIDESAGTDASRDLDMVVLRRTMGATGEMEALAIKGLLDANGISNYVVGNSTLPNLSFFVNVPKTELERAEAVIIEAQAAGPAAALEAERESEGTVPGV